MGKSGSMMGLVVALFKYKYKLQIGLLIMVHHKDEYFWTGQRKTGSSQLFLLFIRKIFAYN